jgi:hypothetical protein
METACFSWRGGTPTPALWCAGAGSYSPRYRRFHRWCTPAQVFHKTFPDRQLVETMTNAVSEDGAASQAPRICPAATSCAPRLCRAAGATMTVTLTTTSKGGQSVTTVDTFSRARDSKRWSSG